MASAEAIARYFLYLAAQGEEPSPITHLQLQKLLYYAQGWTLAMRDRPLFNSEVQAWKHGPVVPEVFPKFTDYGSDAIARHEALDDATLTEDDRAMVEYVWRGYGGFSASRLREMTHSESPWNEARNGVPIDAASRSTISRESMGGYFKGLHEKSLRQSGIDPNVLAGSRKRAAAGDVILFEKLMGELGHDMANRR